MNSDSLPYFTPDLPGIGGSIKQRHEDFFVQEVPLYEPSGSGEHLYCEIQKVGITTFEAVHRLARALNVSARNIGYAGMKDAHAVTRQVFSIQGVTEEALAGAKLDDMSVQWAARHGNKLRLGHLKGNRFAIKIRDVEPTAVVKVEPLIARLQQRGMPNFFGEQRFGFRHNNHLLGAALVRGDDPGVLSLLLGTPEPGDPPKVRAAREAFDRHDNNAAMHHWPRSSGMERRILARLTKTHKPSAAVRAIDEKIRRLWVSAVQSQIFNQVLAQRITGIDQIMVGDVAYKHENGACFRVEDAAVEQPRAAAFEISPTGPLLGYRMTLPEGEPLRIEQEAFKNVGLTSGEFRQSGRLRVKGARRPLRAPVSDVELAGGVDQFGPHITVAFTLPSGSFATVLLREIMKSPEGSESDEGTEEAVEPAGAEEEAE